MVHESKAGRTLRVTRAAHAVVPKHVVSRDPALCATAKLDGVAGGKFRERAANLCSVTLSCSFSPASLHARPLQQHHHHKVWSNGAAEEATTRVASQTCWGLGGSKRKLRTGVVPCAPRLGGELLEDPHRRLLPSRLRPTRRDPDDARPLRLGLLKLPLDAAGIPASPHNLDPLKMFNTCWKNAAPRGKRCEQLLEKSSPKCCPLAGAKGGTWSSELSRGARARV